ncbi:MAG: Ribonuclease PH, partial [uncultured Actinomycetospora sp.]
GTQRRQGGRRAPRDQHPARVPAAPRGVGAGLVRADDGAVRGQRHRGGPAVAPGQRSRVAHRRVRDAALGDAHAQRPRVGQGPGRRAHPRDQPAGGPGAARGDRPPRARGEHHPARLRRPAGRRRHAHRGHHRCLRGPRRRGDLAARPQAPRRPAAAVVLDRRGVGGGRRRPGAPRPALRGGLPRRGGHERRRHRHRHARRGAGNRRGRHLHPRHPRRDARQRARRLRAPHRAAGRRARRALSRGAAV